MKFLTTLLLAAAGCSMALADAIPEEQALANARSFFEQGNPSPAMRRMAGKKLQLTKAMKSRGFYAFNINGSEGYDPLIQAALIHYQFETIHPFLDGNGRIGRLLILLYLMERKLLSKPVIYVSYFLKKNQVEYYDRISEVRRSGNY